MFSLFSLSFSIIKRKFEYIDGKIEKDTETLKLFGEQFELNVNELVTRGIENDNTILDQHEEEILHHCKNCKNLNDKNLFNHSNYKFIQEYIRDSKNYRPFLLTGLSGTGKSSLLSYVIKKVKICLFLKGY